FLGGIGDEIGWGIGVDSSYNAYITGSTTSTNFPTVSPVQATNRGNGDAFVAKLNVSGTALLYSTYLGGTNVDQTYNIAVDGSGNAYVAGYTFSTNFPTLNPLQSTNRGSYDAFVAKLTSAGALSYSTYLGGSGIDQAYNIAVDGSGNVYVVGYT